MITGAGNPTDVELEPEFLQVADLLKAVVTGEISGTDVTLAGTGFAAAVVFDERPGRRWDDRGTGSDRCPDRLQRPFDPAEIDASAEYVVVAAIVEGDSRWANRDGVPVITNDNPVTDVIVPVTAVIPWIS